MKDIVVDLSKRIIDECYPDCFGALITGSFIKGTFNENSDVDIILFSELISESYTQKNRDFSNTGYDFDITILPKNKISSLIINDVVSLNGSLTNMLSYGEIIKDNNNFLAEVIEYSKSVSNYYYPSLEYSDVDMTLIMISNALEDLDELSSENETFFTLSFIIELMTNLNIKRAKGFLGKGKNKAKNLKEYCPHFHHELENAITKFKAGDIQFFKNVIKANINTFGGLKEDYSFRNYNITIDSFDNKLIVKVPIRVINSDMFLGLKKFKTFIESKDYTFNFFYLKKSHLVIIVNKKNFGKVFDLRFIICKSFGINVILQNKVSIQKYYPEGIIFGQKKLDYIENHFLITSKYILSFNQNFSFLNSIVSCMFIYNYFIEKLELNKVNDKLLNFLFELWLPESYDYDLKYSFNLLKQRRDLILSEYKSLYKKNEAFFFNEINQPSSDIVDILSMLESNYFFDEINSVDLNLIDFSMKKFNFDEKETNKINLFVYFIDHTFSQFSLMNNKAIIPYVILKTNLL